MPNFLTNQAVLANQVRLFTGFSTIAAETTFKFSHYDIDLINIDLMNHFNTRIGERVMRPEFGCRIWDYLMEQYTSELEGQIIDEVVRVCEFDSRLQVSDMVVVSFDQGIRVEMTLNYLPFNVIQTFTIDFERRQAALIAEQ